MEKLKLMTIIGTRPEIIRLSEIIKASDHYFNHILVHTGQNWDYSLNQVFFEDLNLREPNYYLNSVGQNLGETMGKILANSYEILQKEKPDAVLILGDTNSSLSAICAKRLKIPVFHMEAGNRCYDENVPEELNRRIVDHIADVNLAYTEHSRRNLLSEGIKKEYVFVTGSPMTEVINKNMNQIEKSDILKRLNLKEKGYFLVSAHREENIDQENHFDSLMNCINIIAEKYELPVIYSVHPRTQKFIKEREFHFHKLVQPLNPFGFLDYNKLQKNSYCVLSDSGTLSEESSIMKFAGVLLRSSTERPEVLDKGTITLGGTNYESVIQAIELTKNMFENGAESVLANDYIDTNVSDKVIRIIQSYTKIVNEFIWRKH